MPEKHWSKAEVWKMSQIDYKSLGSISFPSLVQANESRSRPALLYFPQLFHKNNVVLDMDTMNLASIN